MLPALAIPALYSLAGHGLSENAEQRVWTGALKTRTTRKGGRYATGRGKASPLTRTGDLLCPGIDLDDWSTECRAPLFANQWNQWLLLRSTYDGVKESELVDRTLAALARLNARLDGKIRHPKVTVGFQKPWTEGPLRNVFNDCAKFQNAVTLRVSKNDPGAYPIFVRFVYRGGESDTTWFAIKHATWKDAASIVVGNEGCPHEAAWILDTVYQPSNVDVPTTDKDEILPPYWSQNAPVVPSWALPVGLLVGVGAVAVLGSYVVRGFK